jgi:hypothetical protein
VVYAQDHQLRAWCARPDQFQSDVDADLWSAAGCSEDKSQAPASQDQRRLLDSDTTITIGNIEKYSQTSLHEIIYRMFSPEPVGLGLFDEEMQGASRRSSASRHTSHWG